MRPSHGDDEENRATGGRAGEVDAQRPDGADAVARPFHGEGQAHEILRLSTPASPSRRKGALENARAPHTNTSSTEEPYRR